MRGLLCTWVGDSGLTNYLQIDWWAIERFAAISYILVSCCKIRCYFVAMAELNVSTVCVLNNYNKVTWISGRDKCSLYVPIIIDTRYYQEFLKKRL